MGKQIYLKTEKEIRDETEWKTIADTLKHELRWMYISGMDIIL